MTTQKEGLELLINSVADIAIGRALYASGGASSNTKRTNLYDEFGYPTKLIFRNFYDTYERNAVAHSAVHRLLDDCWQDKPTIIDGNESKENKETTDWEASVAKLLKKYWPRIKDADRRNMVGRYSALLIQLRDNKEWSEEVDYSVIKNIKEKALVNLIPLWESQIKVAEWDNDITSETYGQPLMYDFDERPVGENEIYGPIQQKQIHPSRVIILCEGAEDGDMFSGLPLLRAGFNKLLDIEKISGGSAEGFLKNASRQIAVEFDAATEMETIAQAARDSGYTDLGAAMEDKINKLNRGTDSAAVMQAGKMNVLSVAAADPTPSWEVAVREFLTTIRIPFSEFLGTQTGVLAGDKDGAAYGKRLNGRRWGFLTQYVTELIERLWKLGIIDPPKSGEVTLAWSDMLAPSESDKIENMLKMADVATKTQQSFGMSAISPNEVRAVGELEPLEDEGYPPESGAKGDPLVDDEESKDRVTDNTEK
ncbi:anti-CBASS protein Acb1 family protein [Providencia rettgeri]|uniref:anti-CBASS protein Acb1 family protein n=1 Tax=Providencia rettgeri TaxID=587 RepID=UPI0023AB3637|nr:anti-CBASS Acb1 family protein [Providencia rettgeri]